MNSQQPFIHLFRTPGGYYFYDVNTNAILKIQKAMYEFLQSEQEDCDEKELLNSLKRMKENGFLSSKRIRKLIHPNSDTLQYYLDKKLKMIILQVTQQCNLRCEYCAYSGNYKNRGHQNLRMSYETARKCIDFLIRHSGDVSRVNIAFYGGEPLLEFELIKKCINYAEEVSEGKTIGFNFTTNGTLFTKEIIEFFESHDASITISLDGPREVNDKNRRFAVGGCGTFEKISKNLEFFKENYPEYFKKVSFNSVLDRSSDFSCVNEFFASYDVVKESIINISNISENYAKFHSESDESYDSKVKYELFKLYLSKLNKLNDKYMSRLLMNDYNVLRRKMSEERVRTKELPDNGHHGGPCLPGVQRLFADVNGNFYPCERVSENSEVMRIGHINSGFNIEKIRALLNIGKITEESCTNCWAFRFCTVCAAMADDTEKLSPDIKRSNCIASRDAQEQALKDYCTLNEFGHSFGSENGYILMEG